MSHRTGSTAAKFAAANSTQPERSVGHSLDELAARAISEVASRAPRRRTGPSEGMVARLLEAAMGRSDESYRAVARRMMTMGIAPETIVDEYIPATARRMGDEWCNDTSSFAAVTIGSSRLQALLRELSTYWTADATQTGVEPTAAALIIVPEHTHHTLGAAVLSTQLRRSGLSVRLCVGMNARALNVTLDNGDFDAVIISASIGDRLDAVRTLVEIARAPSRSTRPPVILGGTVLQQSADIRCETGADLATVDLGAVMEFCGFSDPGPGSLHAVDSV